MPTVKNLYISAEQTSKAISEVAEQIEYLKVLYRNHNQQYSEDNLKAIIEYESDIRKFKWGIISYLSDDNNYHQWKVATKNNAALFFKYFNKGYFEQEIGYNKDLRIKIIADLKTLYDNTPAEYLHTNKEKQLLRYYNDNNISEENYDKYSAEEQLVLNLYDKESCFNANYNYLLDNLPDNKKLPKEAQNAVVLVKKNPLLLADNPFHYVLNRHPGKYPTVSCDKFLHLLLDSTVGDYDAIDTLKKMVITLDKLDSKESQKAAIRSIRENALSSDITNKNKKTY